MKSFSEIIRQLTEAKSTYTIKDREGNIKHAGTDKDIAYKTHKSLNAKEPGHKLYKNGVSCLTEGPFQPNGTDKVDYEKGMDGNAQSPDKKTKKSKNYGDIKILNGEQEPAIREETDLDEAHKINDRVEIIKGSAKGTTGRIGEIRHGMFKGAAKTYTVYHGEHGATQVPKEHIRKLKEDTELDESYRNPTDSEIDRIKAHVKVNHPNKTLVSAGVHKQTKNIEYVVKDKEGKTVGHTLKEDTLDELSNKLLNRYSKKAEKEAGKNFMAADSAQDRGNYDKAQTHMDKADKRASGVYKAQSKIKEESLDEISKEILGNYANKSFARGNEIHNQLDKQVNDYQSPEERAKLKAELTKRNQGVIKAAQKMRKEDMDEAVDTVKKDAKGKVLAWSHEGDWEKMSTKNKQGSGKAANLAGKALQKTKQLSKEEVEEIDEKLKDAYHTSVENGVFKQAHGKNYLHDKDQKAYGANDKLTDEPRIATFDKESHAKKAAKQHGGTVAKMRLGSYRVVKEEVELDELSKTTLGNYVKKASGQATSASVTAKSSELGANNLQARGVNPRLADLQRKNAEDSKELAAKRTAGVSRAVDKLSKEEVEEFMQTEAYDQLDELSKKTLSSYVKKAALSQHYNNKNFNSKETNNKDTQSDDDKIAGVKKSSKRTMGVMTAVNKLTKEDNMLSYSEFMAQLAESRADDLRDKLAADREARLDNLDFSKEKTAKKSPVTKVAGRSYGAGEEGDAEKHEPVEPAEKKGRGRPAGSKSGARI